MLIEHNVELSKFSTIEEGLEAYVEYRIANGELDILHTYVPPQLEGRGIASKIVAAAYDWALKEHLTPIATCPYAKAWLQRHPEYISSK